MQKKLERKDQQYTDENGAGGGGLSQEAREALSGIKESFDKLKSRNLELDTIIQKEKEEREGLELRMNKRGLVAPSAPGEAPDEFLCTKDGRKLPLLKKDQPFAAHVSGDSAPEHDFKFGDFCRMAIGGARNDQERKALGQLSDPGGGFLVSPFLSGEFIDLLRPRSVAFEAGARTLPMPTGEVNIARLDNDPVVAWRQENALVATGDPSFGQQPLIARSLACLIKVSRELADDAANAGQIIQDALAAAMAAEIDRAVIHGDGITEPLGLLNTGGLSVVSMGTNGGQITNYDKLLDGIESLENSNVGAPTAAILSPRTKRAFSGLKDTTNQPLRKPNDVEGLPFLHTSSMPNNLVQGSANNASSIIVGDFSRMIVGVRSEVRIEVLHEAFADRLQIGLLAHARIAVTTTHAKAFVAIKGITP